MKRKAAEGYTLIPEGEQVLKITKVDDSNYEKFGKLIITFASASGATARENYNFVNDDDTTNEVADGIYTRLARAALNDQTLDEFDSDDLVGKFINVEVVHNTGSKGGTFANIKKILGHANGFPANQAAKPTAASAANTHKKSAAEILAEAKARREAAGK